MGPAEDLNSLQFNDSGMVAATRKMRKPRWINLVKVNGPENFAVSL